MQLLNAPTNDDASNAVTMITPNKAPESRPSNPAKRVEVLPSIMMPGTPLTETQLQILEAGGISRDAADRAMLRSLTDAEGRSVTGHHGHTDYSGIAFPNVWPGEPVAREYSLRLANPPVEWDAKKGRAKERHKYLRPTQRPNMLYITPGTPQEWLSDVDVPAVFIEGEKKTIAVDDAMAQQGATALVIGLSGVWNHRGTIGKEPGPNGERRDVKGPIADLDRISWKNRTVVILYDADLTTNKSVAAARQDLAWELTRRGAKVRLANMPAVEGAEKIDDLIALKGPAVAVEVITSAVPFRNLMQAGQYRSDDTGIYRVITKENDVEHQRLSNFAAVIVSQGVIDDGAEESRYFEIEACVSGKRRTFRIPAADLDGLEWVPVHLGAQAVIFPGRIAKEHLRAAIRLLSGNIPETHTFAHTGWREIEGVSRYLHKGGAIGSDGAVTTVDVALPQALKYFELPPPLTGEELRSAVRASLALWDLAVDSISICLWAAAFRAALGKCDVSVFLCGHTGRGKSELAARIQQHFGARMDRKNLPGNWVSTANANESLAHKAKDAVLVVDDFIPHGSSADVARQHRDGDRLLRGQGNQSGRQRMSATGGDLPGRHPRGLIISTGEDVPRGQSLAARMMIVSVGPNDLNWDRMTEAQEAGREGKFAAAMSGYVSWLAARYDEIQRELRGRIEELRKAAAIASSHRHTPENIANLGAGLHYGLEFALSIGAISPEERERLWRRGWSALCQAGCSQRLYQDVNDPTGQFLGYLASAITSGRAHVAAGCGGMPPTPSAWGWRERSGQWEPHGDLVGWVDGDDLFLEPKSAYRVVQIIVRDSNGSLALGESGVWKRMAEKKLLVTMEKKRETYKVRRTLAGTQRSVLHLRADALLPLADADSDGDGGGDQPAPTLPSEDSTRFKNEMSELSVSIADAPSMQEELFG